MNNDNVNNPKHYQGVNGLEVIEVMENFIPKLEGMKAVCMANIIKYVLRHPEKNGVEDLMKARWYLDRLITYYNDQLSVDHPVETYCKTITKPSELLLFSINSTDDMYIRQYYSELCEMKDDMKRWSYIVDIMSKHGKRPEYYFTQVKDLNIIWHEDTTPSMDVYITLEEN